MANYGVQYKKAYVTTPYEKIDTNSAAVQRTFVDNVVSSTTDVVLDGGTIPVGIKLRPGARVVGCLLSSNGTGGAASDVTGVLRMTDGTTTTVLTATVSFEGGDADSDVLLVALNSAGGATLDGGEISFDILIAGDDYDLAGGAIGVRVDYLDI